MTTDNNEHTEVLIRPGGAEKIVKHGKPIDNSYIEDVERVKKRKHGNLLRKELQRGDWKIIRACERLIWEMSSRGEIDLRELGLSNESLSERDRIRNEIQ